MGYKYQGIPFEDLPPTIRDRIIKSAIVAERETEGLGIDVVEYTRLKQRSADEIWQKFGSAQEVFVFDFEVLQEVYFREGNRVYKLDFVGGSSLEEREKIEIALGLNVKIRPKENFSAHRVYVEGQRLERIEGLGHQLINEPSVQTRPSGPYMGKMQRKL